MRLCAGLLLLVCVSCCTASEPGCYRTPGDAVAASGARGVDGFRVESIRQDLMAGRTWAIVRSCAHPEWPGSVVLAEAGFARGRFRETATPVMTKVFLMPAGKRVLLLAQGPFVQMEMPGVLLENAALGDRVKVRLLHVNQDESTPEHVVAGVVKSSGVILMEAQ